MGPPESKLGPPESSKPSSSKAKAQLKAKYDSGGHVAGLTLSVAASDVKLRTSFTDATFRDGKPSLDGLVLGIEKPGHFIFDYDPVPHSFRFQFHSSVSVLGKALKMTYIHPQKRNATLVEGQYVWDPRNKVTAKYSFATEKGSLKYTYVNKHWNLTVEPGYDFHTEAWNFSIGKKIGEDHLKAHYNTSNAVLGLELIRDAKHFGAFKIHSSFGLQEKRAPKFLAERLWDVEF